MESIDQVWIFGAIVLVAGVMLGALLHKKLASSSGDVARLKADLEQVRTEMEDYKARVNSHFAKTSDLVSDLTQDYVKVYQHLAEGAHTLSDEPKFTQMLEQSKGKVLISVAEDIPAPEAVVVDAVSETPEPAATQDDDDADGEKADSVAMEDDNRASAKAPEDDLSAADSDRRDPKIGDEVADDGHTPPVAADPDVAETGAEETDPKREKKPSPTPA